MMKLINSTVFVGLALLTACGQSDRSVIVNACIEQGESKEKCTCAADLAKENLSPEIFAAVADITRSGEEQSAAFLQNMSITDAVELASLAVETSQTCKISGLDGLLP